MSLSESKEKWTARLFVLMIMLHVAQTLLVAEDVMWKHCCLPSFASLLQITPGIYPLHFLIHVSSKILRWVGHSLFHVDVSHLFSNLLLFVWVGPALEHGHDGFLGEGGYVLLLLFIWCCKPLVAGLLTALLWPGTYKCSTGFSGVVYGLLAVEVCLFYRSRRIWEVAGLVKHAFLLKTIILVWEELRADSSVLKDKSDGTHHAGHLAGILTGCLFMLVMQYSLRFQNLARRICRRWALPFPFLDETSIATIAKEGDDTSKGIVDGA